MKSLLKVGFVALGFIAFLTACEPSGNQGNGQDSNQGMEQTDPSGIQQQPMPEQETPQDMPSNDVDTSNLQKEDTNEPGM